MSNELLAAPMIAAFAAIHHSSFMFRHSAWLFASFFLIASSACAHPLQAEPINHAFVYTFDQFNIPEDPDESLVNGGPLARDLMPIRCG